jgi:hypothetical protein
MRAPPGLENNLHLGTPGSMGKRLNSQAAAFVPNCPTSAATAKASGNTQQLRHSIHRLKEVLEGWERENLDTPDAGECVGSVEDQTFLALQEALSKLTPEDAVAVRNFLDSKDVQPKPAAPPGYGCNQPPMHQYYASHHPPQYHPPWAQQSFRPQGTAAAPMHRPFTPFGAQSQPPRRPKMTTSKPTEDPDDTGESLRSHLRDLASLDTSRVLMLRKINRLGTDSAKVLETYFSGFGKVERMMISHSRSRSTAGQLRIRPATVGFAVMGTAEEAQAVLALGAAHDVQGFTIAVSTFESHSID